MRSIKHWTPRYIVNRLGLLAYERLHPEDPWFNKAAIKILDSWLTNKDRGVEWGSGRSTVWFAERVGSLISIEHDEKWYRIVSAVLAKKGLRNVDLRLCPEEADYCSAAESLPREGFDFCLVDGLARDRCALSALSLLKPEGVVVVDNCNCYIPTQSRSPFSRRPEQGPYTERWAAYLNGVEGWRQIWTTNGVSDACLWMKPAAAREPHGLAERLERASSQELS